MEQGRVTNREQQVLQLVAKSYETKEIARLLSMAPKTVNDLRMKVCDKLGIRGIAAMTRYAIRSGLVSAEE